MWKNNGEPFKSKVTAADMKVAIFLVQISPLLDYMDLQPCYLLLLVIFFLLLVCHSVQPVFPCAQRRVTILKWCQYVQRQLVQRLYHYWWARYKFQPMSPWWDKSLLFCCQCHSTLTSGVSKLCSIQRNNSKTCLVLAEIPYILWLRLVHVSQTFSKQL